MGKRSNKSAKGALPPDLRYLLGVEKLVALYLVLGYVTISVIDISKGRFTLTVRGPVFWRLTSGLSPVLEPPTQGLAGEAFLRIEALVAYLLFVEEAHFVQATATASSTLWTIGSKWFTSKSIQKLLKEDRVVTRHAPAILALMNLAIGTSLLLRKLPTLVTSVNYNRDLSLSFNISADPLQRTKRQLPSKLTIPMLSSKLYVLSAIVGFLLIVQRAKINSVILEKGGMLGFSVVSDAFRFHTLPHILNIIEREW